jgi:hypothetical protein
MDKSDDLSSIEGLGAAISRAEGPMTQPRVLSERLELTPLAGTAVDALLARDTGTLERLTGARFADAAPPPYMADALPVVRDRLRVAPAEASWWNWLVVRRETREWVFAQAGVREVRALAPVWNTPALRVAENVGMRPVASEEDDDVGEVLLYALTTPASAGSA